MTIGFERVMYTVNETDGTVEVAVVLLQGSLSKSVVVRVYTTDGTAKSESFSMYKDVLLKDSHAFSFCPFSSR